MNPAKRRRSAAQADPATRRVAGLLKKDGEHCHGCRRHFTNGETSVAGFTASGRLIVVGDCCADKLGSVAGFGIFLACPPPIPPWQEDDRAWFEAHPDRSHRLRRTYPGEHPGCSHVAVRQVREGQRHRVPFTAPGDMPEDAPEEAAWALCDLLCEALARGDDAVPIKAIRERMRLLSGGGRA